MTKYIQPIITLIMAASICVLIIYIIRFIVVSDAYLNELKKSQLHLMEYNQLRDKYPRIRYDWYCEIKSEMGDNPVDTRLGDNTAYMCALISTESDWIASARGAKGEYSLCQLLPGTASDLKIKNPRDPIQNIKGGCKHFKMCLKKSAGNVELALMMYNGGHNRDIKTLYKISGDYAAKCLMKAGSI